MFEKLTAELSIVCGYPRLAIRLAAAISFSSVLSLSGWWLISTNWTFLWVFVFLFSAGGDVLFKLSVVVLLFFGARAAEELFFWPLFFENFSSRLLPDMFSKIDSIIALFVILLHLFAKWSLNLLLTVFLLRADCFLILKW